MNIRIEIQKRIKTRRDDLKTVLKHKIKSQIGRKQEKMKRHLSRKADTKMQKEQVDGKTYLEHERLRGGNEVLGAS